MFRRIILREGYPALGLDRLKSECAVARRPGQHYANGPLALILRQRFKEGIDGPMRRAAPRAQLKYQGACGDGEVRVRCNDVDVIRLDRLIVRDLLYRERCGARENLRQSALVLGIEVLHQDEPHPGVERQSLEQLRERLKTTG